MLSATGGGDATAMIERRADQIVARFRCTNRGMCREGDVFQRGQDVICRQGLYGEDVEAGMADMARAQHSQRFQALSRRYPRRLPIRSSGRSY